MFSFTFFLIFIPILTIILLVINLLFATHKPYQEKNSPFECGFDSFTDQNREEAEIGYFVFALLFMIVDIELIAVAPVLVNFKQNEGYGLIMLIIFLIVLGIGFVYEIGKNVLYIPSRQYENTNNTQVIINNYKFYYFTTFFRKKKYQKHALKKREKSKKKVCIKKIDNSFLMNTYTYYTFCKSFCFRVLSYKIQIFSYNISVSTIIKLLKFVFKIFTFFFGGGLYISFFGSSDDVSSIDLGDKGNNKRPLADDNYDKEEESKFKRTKNSEEIFYNEEVRRVIYDAEERPQHPNDVYKGRENPDDISKEELSKEDSQHPEDISKEESEYAENTSNLDPSTLDPSNIDPRKEEPKYDWFRDWFTGDTDKYHGNTSKRMTKLGDKWNTKFPPTDFENEYPENIPEAYSEITPPSQEFTKPNRNIPGGDEKAEDERLTDLRNAVIKSSRERDEAEEWNEDSEGAIARKHERAVDDLREYLNKNNKTNFGFDNIKTVSHTASEYTDNRVEIPGASLANQQKNNKE